MKRKNLIIIAAILMVIIAGGITAYLFLGRSNQETDEEDFLPEAFMVDIDSLKETTLTFYINGQRTKDDEEVLKAVNRKLREDLKTSISFKYYWEWYEQFLDRVKRDNASGITCDAFLLNKDFRPTVKEIADKGLAMDVSKLFPEYAPNYYNQFTREELKVLDVGGGIYLIPPRMPSANMKYALVRQDLMEKYNIPEIRNYDDFEVFLGAIAKNEPGMIPVRYKDTSLGLFADMYGYVILDYFTGLVYKWDDPDMRITTWDRTPEYKEGILRMWRWKLNGYMDAESNNQAGKNYNENGKYEITYFDHIVADNKTASFICSPDEQMRFNKLLRSKGITDIYFKAYPLYDGYSPRDTAMESGVIINPASRQAERVLMFIDWLQSDSTNYDLLMYGQKDINYIDRGDYVEPPADAVVTFNDWSWRTAFENIGYLRATYPGQKNELKEYNNLIRERSKYAPHYGFTPDFSAVRDLYDRMHMYYSFPESIIYSDIDSRIDINEQGLDVIDQYIDIFHKDQNEADVNRFISEIQGQLDEYIKSIDG